VRRKPTVDKDNEDDDPVVDWRNRIENFIDSLPVVD
jgi:hypothetical protein